MGCIERGSRRGQSRVLVSIRRAGFQEQALLVAREAELERRAEPEGEHRARRRHRGRRKVPVEMSQRLEDYAMIGDCRTAALVARDGAIDWLCLPRFDSPACFAKLLGDRGAWFLANCAPASSVQDERAYRERRSSSRPSTRPERRGARHRLHAGRHGALPKLVRIVEGSRARSKCAWSSPSVSTTGDRALGDADRVE